VVFSDYFGAEFRNAFGNDFDDANGFGFDDFYNAQGRRAGTYTYRNGSWSRR
jgi:hypothetical protein